MLQAKSIDQLIGYPDMIVDDDKLNEEFKEVCPCTNKVIRLHYQPKHTHTHTHAHAHTHSQPPKRFWCVNFTIFSFNKLKFK